MKVQTIISTFILLLCINAAVAQENSSEPITIGQKYILNSEVLDQDRPIMVYLPSEYEKDSSTTYPVMYLLDGGGNFHHTTACVNFLAKNQRIPKMIVVGIPNTDDRTRDLTPPILSDSDQFPTAGGADSLVGFIDKELVPFIDAQFRTNPYKMLVGHSFGGLFAIHTMVHHPDIFNSYLSISPSLWWDNQELVKNQSEMALADKKDRKGHLYMTMGNEGGDMLGGAMKFAALLEEKAPQNFKWEFDHMNEETHGSIPHRSTYKGLEFIFKDWDINKRKEDIELAGIEALNIYEEEVKQLYGFEPSWSERKLMSFGQSLIAKGKPLKAAPIFEKVTKIAPKSELAWAHYGECLAQSGEKEKAKEVLMKALKLNPENLVAQASMIKMGMKIPGIEEVSFTPKQLNLYSGDYSLNVGPTLVITNDGKDLHAEAPILEKEALVALGNHRFFVSSKSSTIIFEMDGEKVKGLKVNTPDGDFSGTKKIIE